HTTQLVDHEPDGSPIRITPPHGALSIRQVIVRTLRRRFGRQELWNGNIEPPLHRIFFDREYIVRWAWSTYRLTTERVQRLSARCPELTIVRFRSHRDVDAWIAHQLIPLT
ncbi:MAG: hypothetical protein V7694_25340, partial [Rhodococcus sp. (in: high G+C Gram-positive bacteria)]